MGIEKKFLLFILFIIIVFVLLNQLIKLSIFAYKYYNYYIIANINKMSCGNYFNESEHPRFHISKNIYDLHIDNDIFNSKTYIIIIYIFSIFLYIYAFLHLVEVFSNESFDNELLLPSSYIIIISLIVLYLAYFITIMVLRFDHGDKGYKLFYSYGDIVNDSYGWRKYVFELLFYSFTAFILFIYIIFLFYKKTDKLELGIIFYVFASAGFYMFALYFMNNLLNIVLSFKNNEYPLKENENFDINELDNYYNIEKNTNAIFYNNIDISYGSENYFYKQYLEYSKNNWWFDIYRDIHDLQKMKYKTSTSYNIANLKDSDTDTNNSIAVYTGNIRNFILIIIVIIMCSIGLFLFLVLFNYSINLYFNYEKIVKYAINIFLNIIVPLLLLFIIIFVIIATMEYNTLINKDILITINTEYKKDLNNLNNSIIPVLYLKDKQIKDNIDSIKYSYIIYNVIISYLLNTINIFDLSSIIPENKEEIIGNKRIVKTEYIINDIISPHKDTYNIDSIFYNNNYYTDLSDDKINNLSAILSANLSDNKSFNSNEFKNYIDIINNNIKNNINNNIDSYIKYNSNIFNNNKIENNNIKNNIKNNILCSMYNIDNFLNIKDNDNDKKIYYFRNNIFFKENNKNIYINKFLLKSNLDNMNMNFNKYKKYYYYIDNIIDDFIKNLKDLNYNVNLYEKSNNKNIVKISIVNTFNLIITKLKDTIDNMINNFLNLENDSNNIIFENIIKNYKKINNEENISMRAYDITEKKFTNHFDVKTNPMIFDNKSKNEVKDNTKDIDLLKKHENIVKNANYVINERLYVLIATYIISLFIAYKLHKM